MRGKPGVHALAVAETTSWGILYYSFGVLLAPFETAFAASRVTISGAFSLALLTSGLAARPVGHSLERWGVRHVMTLGALLGIVSYGLLAIVTNLTATVSRLGEANSILGSQEQNRRRVPVSRAGVRTDV